MLLILSSRCQNANCSSWTDQSFSRKPRRSSLIYTVNEICNKSKQCHTVRQHFGTSWLHMRLLSLSKTLAWPNLYFTLHVLYSKHNMQIILNFKYVLFIPCLEEFVQKKVVKMFPLLPGQGTKYISCTCGSELQLYRIEALQCEIESSHVCVNITMNDGFSNSTLNR